jgi:hypothetical protein
MVLDNKQMLKLLGLNIIDNIEELRIISQWDSNYNIIHRIEFKAKVQEGRRKSEIFNEYNTKLKNMGIIKMLP